MLPTSALPYAKAVVAFAVGAVALVVQAAFIDSQTGVLITSAIELVAVTLGVVATANVPSKANSS